MKSLLRWSWVALVLVSVAVTTVRADEEFADTTLGTVDQRALDALVLRVLASPEVRRQRAESRRVYESDPVAQTPDGRATLDAALDSITTAMVQGAVNDDASRPMLGWSANAAHTWFGRDIPNSGYGIENPDNVYRQIRMDSASRYEIRGRIPRQPPSHFSFTLYGAFPGMGSLDREGSLIVGALDEVETGPNGEFTVTVDADPAAGRPNHIQTGKQTARLNVRNSLMDWAVESPVPLDVERVGGPSPGPPHTEQQMAQRAVWFMERAIPFWARYNNEYIYTRPVNKVLPPRTRGGGWGFSTTGHFELADDEALVVTLDRLGARYLGFQLADPWGVGLEYDRRSGSLNAAQARPNPDGSITYVVAASDPGAHNWLDTSGLGRGIFAIRWQGVPASLTSADGAVRGAKVVEQSELSDALPPGTAMVGSGERRNQLAQREASYKRRLRE